MRKIVLVVLVVVLLSVPVMAAPRDAYLGDLAVVSWLEQDTVMVAIANESSSRKSVTVSTDTWDSRWRPVFSDRTVLVPARTIIVEAFTLSSYWRGDPVSIEISEWSRSITVEAQMSDIMQPTAYVIRANDEWEVKVDLAFLMDSREPVRLVIDDFYQVAGSGSRGRIQVKKFEGGLEYFPSRNSIEFVKPYMVLSMKAPQLNNVGVMTFSMFRVVDTYRGYQEEIIGPTVLVYGRNLRFTDNTHITPEPKLPPIITR